MAEQVTNDVVKEAQSVGRPAPIDDTASTTSTLAANGELPSGPATLNTTLSDPSSSTVPRATSADAAPPGPAQALGAAGRVEAAKTNNQFPPGAPSQEARQPLLNGTSDSGEHSEHAIADASGGSDTDISRPGSVDPSKQEPGHVRTGSSVKKPSTFKSVSVTKNFLAKSVVSTPVARPGEKAASAALSASPSLLTAKPRLVAKTGTGNTPRTLGMVNGAGSGPDASKVWNKNQPIPPPPPKQFTDEELKQQYGIHLATRLQADEAGKEAKWADIDDDEDDWAPDTVQWMDGTKSSGAAVENEPPPPPPQQVEEQRTILKIPDSSAEGTKPVPTTAMAASKTSVTGGAKTILKPGTHVQPVTGKSSLVLKGQPEKPTLVTKTSSSEKKSPWATLPPVEKVPPVQVNPSSQQPPVQRFAPRESYGYDQVPPLPTKEIAPDDFNRSWRDERGGRQELYNSQSGRYEPVGDMRRGSVRDTGVRQQPSVLQRPSQDGGPAEPSAAFQTSRAGGDAPSWGRRRNSSNVSGGNGRRMSFDRRAPELSNGHHGIERRGSHSTNGIEPSDSGHPRHPTLAPPMSPNVASAHPSSPYGSVASSGPQDLPVSTNVQPPEDPVEVQKRLMAEKIERARLKKQQQREAEEREEAERKERLAKRLAAMGPPKVKEQALAQDSAQSPKKDKLSPVTAQSPPKPPVPTIDGEVAQYGMMKVHHSQPVKKLSPAEPTLGSKPATSNESASGSSATGAQADTSARPSLSPGQQPTQSGENSTRANEKARSSNEPHSSTAHQTDGTNTAGSKPQANWQASATQPRGWTSQVWGPPPTKERALGNGTFVSNYERGQPRSGPQPQLPTQTHPSSVASVPLSLASKPSTAQPVASTSTPQSASMTGQVVTSNNPGPIAPPSANGWSNFAAHIRQDDKNIAAKARQELERMSGEPFRPEIRETYKDQRGQSQVTLHDKITGHINLPSSGLKKDDIAKSVHEAPSAQQILSQGTPLQQATGPRASRFFPRSSESTTQPTTAAPPTSGKADSPPPPPETESHPAYVGNTDHPLVRLPKPSPVVRLPPSATASAVQAETPVSMPSRGNTGLGARPLAMNPEWQARFNKLLEKPGSPAAQSRSTVAAPALAPSRPGSLPVAASSKAALDVRGNTDSATVSLPNAPTRKIFANDRGQDTITRKGTEGLFEDREFGSLPTVKMSQVSHLAANEPVAVPSTDDSLLIRFKKIENPFTMRRLEVFDIEKGAQRIDVVIRIQNMREGIIKSMPRGRRWPKSTNLHNRPKRSNGPNASPSTSSKDRPRKASQAPGDRPSSSPHTATSNAWAGNNRSSPGHAAHQKSTWARLAAAPVH